MNEEPKKKPRWKTLESNPDVINQFVWALGMSKEWKWMDCWGLDSQTLAFIPRPCRAVMFLYPTTNLKEDKEKERERIEKEGQEVSPKIYFVKQLVGNACGTIAVVHALANNIHTIQLGKKAPSDVLTSKTEDKALKKFIDRTKDNTPHERGELLGYDDGIADAHEASSKKGQTRHDAVQPSDFHFICFTEVDGALYELDGGKAFPINHGKTTPDTFLEDAAKVIQKNFIEKNLKDPFFSVLTLVPSQPDDVVNTEERLSQIAPSEVDLVTLISMGFDKEQALNALLVCENNLEQATNYLLSSTQ